MTEQVMTNLITAGAAIAGAIVGCVGTLLATKRSLDYTRRKDNFQIKRDHLETSIKAWGAVKHASDSLANEYVHDSAKDNTDLLRGYARQITSICSCMAATPWVFSQKARDLELRLKGDLGLFSLAVDLPNIIAWDVVQNKMTMEVLEEFPKKHSEKLMALLSSLSERLAAMRSLAEAELERLNSEYNKLIASGI